MEIINLFNFSCYSVPPAFNEKLDPTLECLNQPYTENNKEVIDALNKVKKLDLQGWLDVKPNVAFVCKSIMEKEVDIYWMEEKLSKSICYELKSITKKAKKEKESFMLKYIESTKNGIKNIEPKNGLLTKSKIKKIKTWLFFIEDIKEFIKFQSEKSVCFIDDTEVLVMLNKANKELEDFLNISKEVKQCQEEAKKEVLNNIQDIKEIFEKQKIDFNKMSRFYCLDDSKSTWLYQIKDMQEKAKENTQTINLQENEMKESVVDQLIIMLNLFEKGILGLFLLKMIFMESRLFDLNEKTRFSVDEIYENKLSFYERKENKRGFRCRDMEDMISNEMEIKEKITQELEVAKSDYVFIHKNKAIFNDYFLKIFNLESKDQIIEIKVSKENRSFFVNYANISLIGVETKEEDHRYIQSVKLENYDENIDIEKIKTLADLNGVPYQSISSFPDVSTFCQELNTDFVQNYIFETSGKKVQLTYL